MDNSTYGLSVELLRSVTGAHIDTVRRWKRTGRFPQHWYPIIALKLHGELGTVARHWTGFALRDNTLWTPEGQAITPGDIRAIPYRRDQLKALERLLAEPHQRSLF